jgi:hypothetical protein
MRTAKKDPAPQGGTSKRCVSTGVFLSGFLLSIVSRNLRVSSAPTWVAGERTLACAHLAASHAACP